MTGNAELVPVRVAKVRAVVVVMVLRAQSWRAFTGASILQRNLVRRSDGRPGARCKGKHLTISGLMRLSVKGFTDDEERARAACAVPASPWSLSLAEAQFNTKAVHHCAVEVQGALKIVDAYKDMGKHLGSSGNLQDNFDRPLMADGTHSAQARHRRHPLGSVRCFSAQCQNLA
jgi:hypothetical protein